MTEDEFNEGITAVRMIYSETRILEISDSLRPLRVAPIRMPTTFWGGGITRLLLVFNLSLHETTRPIGYLGDEWKLPNGNKPFNATPTYQYGETWHGYSWAFPWPPALGVLQTVEAYLGRFNDNR